MTSLTSQLQVQHININELKVSKFNPRTWSDHQLAKLRESMEKFGVVDPLVLLSDSRVKSDFWSGNPVWVFTCLVWLPQIGSNQKVKFTWSNYILWIANQKFPNTRLTED